MNLQEIPNLFELVLNPQLTQLTSNRQINDECISAIITHVPKLKTLKLEGIKDSNIRTKDGFAVSLLQAKKALKLTLKTWRLKILKSIILYLFIPFAN